MGITRRTRCLCRREDELARYHLEGQIEVPLTLTPDFNFSSGFESGGAAEGQAAAAEAGLPVVAGSAQDDSGAAAR